jgi:predicted acetyltransferase
MERLLRLTKASLQPPEGLEAFLIELGRGEKGFGGTDYAPSEEKLSQFLQRVVDREGGNVPPGFVPMTTFWLLDDAGAIAGMSRLRHVLNDELLHHGGHIGYYVRRAFRGRGCGNDVLRLTLAEGRSRGIERFLLTVDSQNAPSIGVIEHHGGDMEDERIDNETQRPFRRYWIG